MARYLIVAALALAGAQARPVFYHMDMDHSGAHGGMHGAHAQLAEGPAAGLKPVERTFGGYKPLPQSREDMEKDQGFWIKEDVCTPFRGFRWRQYHGSPRTLPLSMYVDTKGKVVGLGTQAYDLDYVSGSMSKYWEPEVSVNEAGNVPSHHLMVSFHGLDKDCNYNASSSQEKKILSQLAINPSIADGVPVDTVPMVAPKDLDAEGWHRGSCFDGMGWHWFRSLDGSTFDYSAKNTLPIVPMYATDDTQELGAIFFATWAPDTDESQPRRSVINPGTLFGGDVTWEKGALCHSLMCLNDCSDACNFSGYWSTMHIYFRDHEDKALQCKDLGLVGKLCALGGVNCCSAKASEAVAVLV